MLDELVARVPPTKRIKLRGGPWSGLGQFLPNPVQSRRYLECCLKYSMQLGLFFMNENWILKCLESVVVNIYGSNTKEYLSHIHR